jgi:hypothetical protein
MVPRLLLHPSWTAGACPALSELGDEAGTQGGIETWVMVGAGSGEPARRPSNSSASSARRVSSCMCVHAPERVSGEFLQRFFLWPRCGIRRLTSTTASGPVDDNSAAAMGSLSNSSATDQASLFDGGAIATMPRLVVFAVLQPSLIQGLTVGACIERLVRP